MLELRLRNVMGPIIVKAIAVMIQTTIVAAFTFNLVRCFSIIGPETTPKDPANKATKPYWSPILVCSHPCIPVSYTHLTLPTIYSV